MHVKNSAYVCVKHACVRKLPEHTHRLDMAGLPEEEGWANTRVPGVGQAADQGIGSAWDWQDESVTGPVWDRNESGNHGFFPLLVQ